MKNTIRNNPGNPVVASDLNGTLTTGSPVLAVYRWLSENQPGAIPPLFLYKIMASYLLVRIGWKPIDLWGQEAMRAVLGLVQDPDPTLVDELMAFVVEDELWAKRRQVPIELLQEFHHQGCELFILSAAYHPAVEKFSHKISPDRTFGIGTPIGITADGLTLTAPLNSRDRKMNRLLAAIGSQKLSIALGDTFADIPLLENAERAIAVYPDPLLKKKAEQEGWQIIG